MRSHLVILAAALAFAAGCDRKDEKAPAGSGSTQPPAQAQSNTPTTPANVGQPSAQEKKDGASPVQGQVDTKQPEQQRDFQQRGDGAGPKGPDAAPKRGG